MPPVFEYGGLHFQPVRKFAGKENDFFAITRYLRSDPELGTSTYSRKKWNYNYRGFYDAASDKECDVFYCIETGKQYVPGENELFEYSFPEPFRQRQQYAANKPKKERSIAMDEPRIVAGYVIQRGFPIGGKEVAFGINEKDENPYMVCTFAYNALIGADLPERAVAGSDYLEMVQEFTDRIAAETLRLRDIRTMRESRGVDLRAVLTAEDCTPGSRSENYAGQVLVVDPQRLAPEYRDISNQIVYATHGNGCNPNSHGTSVFARNVYTNESERWSRAAVLGIIRPERMPEWAKERLHDIRQEIAMQREKRRSERER